MPNEVEAVRTYEVIEFSLGDTEGYLLDEEDASAYLRDIDAVIVNKNGTEYDGVQKLTIRFPRQPDRDPREIQRGHWCSSLPFQSFASMVERTLLPVLGMDIRVDLLHGERSGPFDDNCFHLLVYSSQENRPDIDVPRKLWGVRSLVNEHAAYPATGRGKVIIAPDAPNYAVAEIIGDALYVHHNALRRGGDDQELQIFRHILEEAAFLLSATQEERAARQEAKRKLERELARTAYVEACRGRVHARVRAAEQTLRDIPRRIDEARQSLTAAIREQALARMEVERLRGKTEDMDMTYQTEFDKLVKHPKVVDVRMTDGKLMVYTDTLFCPDERTGKLHEIGSFRIELSVHDRDVDDGTVRWFNLDRQVDACKSKMQAPHIFRDGNACLGNAYETFAELFAGYEYALAVDYAIQFVENANTDDAAGRYVDKWPLAAEQLQQTVAVVA